MCGCRPTAICIRCWNTTPRCCPALFIVSQVSLDRGAELAVAVERAGGQKCERCWKYTPDVGSEAAFPTICGPCAEAVKEMSNA